MDTTLLKLPRHPFDYLLLMDILKDYEYPRNKILSLVDKGMLIRVKKGLYVLSPEYGGTIDLPVIANLVYGPSYVSLEYALSYWGLIPERVEAVTSVTNKRNKAFDTPLGRFTYRYVNDRVFHRGVLVRDGDTGSFMIASKEKALCDMAAAAKRLEGARDVEPFVWDDMRIDADGLRGLDPALLDDIARAYASVPVRLFAEWYGETFGGKA